jgi:predicted GNAT family acetyltransferase
MEITLKQQNGKGFAMAEINRQTAGIMTYTIPNDDLIIIDHTEVEPNFKGNSVGRELLYEIVDMARKNNRKIIPLRPFAKAMFNKFGIFKMFQESRALTRTMSFRR